MKLAIALAAVLLGYSAFAQTNPPNDPEGPTRPICGAPGPMFQGYEGDASELLEGAIAMLRRDLERLEAFQIESEAEVDEEELTEAGVATMAEGLAQYTAWLQQRIEQLEHCLELEIQRSQ